MTLKEYREVLYKDINFLEKNIDDFKDRLRLDGISSFPTEEALYKLNCVREWLEKQEFEKQEFGWKYCPEDLSGEFPF